MVEVEDIVKEGQYSNGRELSLGVGTGMSNLLIPLGVGLCPPDSWLKSLDLLTVGS